MSNLLSQMRKFDKQSRSRDIGNVKDLQAETASLIKQLEGLQSQAKSLKALVDNKEEQILYLQSQIEDKEEYAKELGAVITETENNIKEMINAVDKELDNMMDNINGQISVLSDKIDAKTSTDSEELIQKLDEIKAANEALSEQLLEVKEEISVNVHKECVKCYRNVQTVIEELQIPKMEDIEKKMNASVSGIKGSVWFGIFLVAVQLALFILNVLGYLPV